MSKPLSFSVRIRRLLGLVGLIGFCVVFTAAAIYETSQLKKEISAVMQGASESCAALIRDYLLQHERYIQQVIAKIPEGGDQAVADHFAEELPLLGPQDHYFVLSKSGRVIQASRGDENFIGLDFSHLEHFPLQGSFSRVHQSLVNLDPVVAIRYQLHHGRTLFIEKDLQSIAPMVAHLTISGPLKRAFSFILSENGTVVYHPNPTMVQSRYPLGFELKEWTEADQHSLQTYEYRGERFISFKQALSPPEGWTFYAAIPFSEMVSQVMNRLLILAAAIAVFFVILIGVLDLLISRRLSSPIAKIATYLVNLNPLEEGSTQMLPASALETSEIAEIVKASSRMAANIKASNEKLMEREDLFRTVTEFASDWTFWLSPDQVVVYVSPSCEAFTGYSPEDFYSRPELMKEVVHPEDKDFCYSHINHAANNEPHVPMEYRIITKNGDVRWMSHVCRGIFDEDGRFLGVRGSNADITEKKRTEEILRESEERFRTLMEQGADGFFVHHHDGTIIEVNEHACRALGYLKEELLSMSIADIDPIYSKEDVEKACATIDSGKAISLESVHRRKDGSDFPVEVRASIVRWGEKDEVFSLVRNITDRKQTEEQLAAEKELLSITLRSIGDGVITTDREGKVVMLSRVAEELTGWTEQGAVGKAFDDVFHIINAENGERLMSPVQQVVDSGQIIGLASETILVHRDGSQRIIADSGAPIRDKKSRIIGVVLVFRDVTEEQRLELEAQKAQKLESLGVLAGGIAHDFNNLLTAILGNITFAQLQLPDNAEIHDKLCAAEKASVKAQGLTQQLLTFAKGGAPIKEVTSLGGIIRDSIDFSLRGSNVKCDLSLADDLKPVEVDPGQMSQVLHNLIINADQAMSEGGTIRVKAANVILDPSNDMGLPTGSYVELVISDEGKGIKPDDLTRIFDPYFTTKEQGSGLGLASSYSIVKRHGGVIVVDSMPSEGTTFTMYLPASMREDTSDEVVEEPPVLVKGKGRVLVMDDEVMVRELTEVVLTTLGYESGLAVDGEEALKMYNEADADGKPYDVVIMDLTIPGGMGGQEAVSKLLEINPQAKIIVSSGYAQDPIMADHEKYGFQGVLAKPYSVQKLGVALHEILASEK